MRTITGIIYRKLIKPLLFLFPADAVHEHMLRVGRWCGRFAWVRAGIAMLWRYDNPMLEQTVCGLRFQNPIGLAAGFDYNADVAPVMTAVGSGFNTIGTLTHGAYAGNTPPMLGRLPKSRSLLVNKGFKNRGVSVVLSDVSDNTPRAPRGVSVGATNKPYPDFDAMVEDLMAGFRDAEGFKNFDYYELNISCPNLHNIQNIHPKIASPAGLRKTLERLSALKLARPVFIKMPLDDTLQDIDSLLSIADNFPLIRGVIFANLHKDPKYKGGLSGMPTQAKSDELIAFARNRFGKRFVIIGCGGVFTAEDAYRKIRAGASLVQMITGMVYMGPQQIGEINKELVALLKKDGYLGIGEAVGVQ